MSLKKQMVLFSVAICFFSNALAQEEKPDSPFDSVIGKTDKYADLRKHKGYFNNSQIGIGVIMAAPVISISTINGYKFSKHFSLGLGVGYTHINYPLWAWRNWRTGKVTKSEYKVGANLFDLFIQPRIYTGQQKRLPIFFFMIDIGYSFCFYPKEHTVTSEELQDWFCRIRKPHTIFDSLITTSYRGGFYAAPGIGLKTYFNKNISLNFSVQLYLATYKIDETTRYGSYEFYSEGGILISGYPMFNIGIGF